jgi:hypothetical protein
VHTCFGKHSLHSVEKKFDFGVEIGRGPPGDWIDANPSGELKRISYQDRIAERQGGRTAWKIDRATRRGFQL